MEKILPLHDPHESVRQFYAIEGTKERIITVGNDDVIQKANYEDRMHTDGFSSDRQIRKVARIWMPTVRLLVKRGDKDAAKYLYMRDEKARDRMIERYPILFKCCSGR